MTLEYQPNWKNVNNWHWVEKNCLPWSEAWLKSSLGSVALTRSSQGAYAEICVENVRGISGDVDLNVRKGKLRYLYDLTLKFDVSATLVATEKPSDKVTCTVSVSEFTFDAVPSDFHYETSGSDSAFNDFVKNSFLSQCIFPVLEEFPKELVKQNSDGLLVAASSSDSNNAVGTMSAPAVSMAAETMPSTIDTISPVVNTGKMTLEEDFKCSPDDLFSVLTDVAKLQAWSRSQCSFSLSIGSEFSLYNGVISGKVLAYEDGKLLQLEWRNKSWPVGVVSSVSFHILSKSDHVKLKVTQTGYPKSLEESERASWNSMVFEPIKHTFGFVY